MTCRKIFAERLYSEWLPSFCNARDQGFSPDGFLGGNLEMLSETDARWFLGALDSGYVKEETGFFLSAASAAKEQIFWSGSTADRPRKLSLWLEPIITIGAVARLIEEYHWPQSQVGLQSKAPWPFDLVGYGMDGNSELMACEVKKRDAEIVRLIAEMHSFSKSQSLAQEPDNSSVKNAYKKVVGIRRSWPIFFWALGPAGNGQLFKIDRRSDDDIFSLLPIAHDMLHYNSILNATGLAP